MEQVRHVDFDFNEFIAETATMGIVDIGILASARALILSHGGAVEVDELRRFVRCRGTVFKRSLDRLLQLGRLVLDGTQICCKATSNRLQTARNRLSKWSQNGFKGGRPPNENKDIAKPGGFHARANLDQSIKFKSLSKKESGNLGRAAPFRGEVAAPASEAEIAPSVTNGAAGEGDRSQGAAAPEEPETLTQEERAERMAILAAVLADLNSKGPAARVRIPVARANTIHDAKREAWLRGLHEWASDRLGGDDRMQAWEAISCAMAAGSRNATPKPVRHYLDQLDRVQRAETAQMQGVA